MLDIYRHFFALRVRWYAKASTQLVLRHWQWFLIAGFFVPGTPIVALPGLCLPAIIHALSPGGDVLSHAVVLASIQLAGFLWILPQRRNLAGGDFVAYSATLPISSIVRRSVDVTLLLVADSPIIIAIVFALCSVPPSDRDVYEICAILIFLPALLTLQVASGKSPWVYLATVAADLLFAFGLAHGQSLLAWPTLPLAAGVLVAPFLIPESRRDRTGAVVQPVSRSSLVIRPRTSALSPALVIQAKALAARPIVTGIRLGVALLLALGTDKLIWVFEFDGRSVPTAIAAMSLAALVLSGLFRTLREAHTPMRDYLATLRIGRHFWPVRDVILVMALGFAPFVILLFPLVAHDLSSLPSFAALSLAYGILIVLLRMVLALRQELTVLLGTMLAAGWTGAAIAAIMR